MSTNEKASEWRGTALVPTIRPRRKTRDILKRPINKEFNFPLPKWQPTGIAFSRWREEYQLRVDDRERLNRIVVIEAARLGTILKRLPSLDELFHMLGPGLKTRLDPTSSLALRETGGRLADLTPTQKKNFRAANLFLEFSIKAAVHLTGCCWFSLNRFVPLFYSDESGAPCVNLLSPNLKSVDLPEIIVTPLDAFVGQILFRVVVGVAFADCLKQFRMCGKKWPVQWCGPFIEFPKMAFHAEAPMFFNFDLDFLRENIVALKREMKSFASERKCTMPVEQIFCVGEFSLPARWNAIISELAKSEAFQAPLLQMTKRVGELSEVFDSLPRNTYLGDLLDVFHELTFSRQ